MIPTQNQVERMQELAGLLSEGTIPSPQPVKQQAPQAADVKALQQAKKSATGVTSREKNIDTAAEFPQAFHDWFVGLGFQPGKISKSVLRAAVEKVLTDLGYK
jgi:hypothetical protein